MVGSHAICCICRVNRTLLRRAHIISDKEHLPTELQHLNVVLRDNSSSSIESGGSGAVVVFLDHSSACARTLTAGEPFFTFLRAKSPHCYSLGARGVLAHLLFVGPFLGCWTNKWSILAQH